MHGIADADPVEDLDRHAVTGSGLLDLLDFHGIDLLGQVGGVAADTDPVAFSKRFMDVQDGDTYPCEVVRHFPDRVFRHGWNLPSPPRRRCGPVVLGVLRLHALRRGAFSVWHAVRPVA